MRRKIRLIAGAVTVFALGSALPSPPVHTQGRTTMTAIATDEDFFRALKELSNWGRWGKDDQLGPSNLITPAKRKQALSLVKEGIFGAVRGWAHRQRGVARRCRTLHART